MTTGSQSLSGTYNNWQDTNRADQNEEVNLKNLTQDQVNTLSEFTSAILNNLRKAAGIDDLVGKTIVTKGMENHAKEVADLYAAEPQLGDGHYIYALKQAAYDHGLTVNPATTADKVTRPSNSFGESLGTE